MLGIVPGMRVAAPRDGARLREELGEALEINDGPTAIRFPKGDVGEDIPALERTSGAGRARGAGRRVGHDVLLVAVGRVRVDGAGGGRAAAQPGHRRDGGRPALGAAGVRSDVTELASAHKLVVTLEDNGVRGGVGSAVSAALRARRDRRAVPRRRAAATVLRPRRRAVRCSADARADRARTWPARSPAGWRRWARRCRSDSRDQRASGLTPSCRDCSSQCAASTGTTSSRCHGRACPRRAGTRRRRRPTSVGVLPVPAQPSHQVG